MHAFAPALQEDGVKIVLQPMAQEMNAYPCDIGTDRDELERQAKAGDLWDSELGVPSEKIDFNAVEEGWNIKVGSLKTRFVNADNSAGRQVGARQSDCPKTRCKASLLVVRPQGGCCGCGLAWRLSACLDRRLVRFQCVPG